MIGQAEKFFLYVLSLLCQIEGCCGGRAGAVFSEKHPCIIKTVQLPAVVSARPLESLGA